MRGRSLKPFHLLCTMGRYRSTDTEKETVSTMKCLKVDWAHNRLVALRHLISG